MKREMKFDEDTGRPILRITIKLKDRTDAEVHAELDELFAALRTKVGDERD